MLPCLVWGLCSFASGCRGVVAHGRALTMVTMVPGLVTQPQRVHHHYRPAQYGDTSREERQAVPGGSGRLGDGTVRYRTAAVACTCI